MQILNLIEFQSTGPVSLILTVDQYPFTGGGGYQGVYPPEVEATSAVGMHPTGILFFSILGYIFNGVDGNATACLVKTIAAQSTLTKLTERTKGNGRGVSNTNQ